MKKSIGFVAIGQAGGNIGKLFESQGYNVLFLNTSQEDLDTLKDAKFKYHIESGEGCNKDRNKAKDLVINDFVSIEKEIKAKIKEEFIFVIFSSGGGTGSGASPMLIDLLSQSATDKKVCAITILPASNEPIKAQINAYECFKELEGIDGLHCIFVLDNNGKDKIAINNHLIQLFNDMIDIPSHKDMRGNIDLAELKEILSARGCTIIVTLSKTNSTMPKLLEGFKNNIFAPLENDKVVKYVGLSTTSTFNTEDISKEIGVYLDLYHNYNTERTVCILSGLSLPVTRLASIKKVVDDNKDAVQKNLTEAMKPKLDNNINFLEQAPEQPKSKISPDDIFSKYRKKGANGGSAI